jgi:hypothetical protein
VAPEHGASTVERKTETGKWKLENRNSPRCVILSEAKDLRSFLGLNDSRATSEILRFAQDDSRLMGLQFAWAMDSRFRGND